MLLNFYNYYYYYYRYYWCNACARRLDHFDAIRGPSSERQLNTRPNDIIIVYTMNV